MIRAIPFLLAAAIACADTVIERTSTVKTTKQDGQVETVPCRERVTIHGANVRIEDLDLSDAWIFRMDKDVLWYVDARGRRYAEVPFDIVRARRLELIQQIKECAQRVTDKDMNARYAEILAQLGDGGAAVDIAANADTSDVAGQACVHIRVTAGKYPVMDALVAKGMAGAAEYARAMGRIEAWPAGVADALAKEGIFPMKGKTRMSFLLARVERSDEVTKLDTHAAVDAKLFELPQGLKKVELPGFEAQRGPKEAPKGGFDQEGGK